MLWARGVMDEWVGEDGGQPHIKTLTAYFLVLYAIMATQVRDAALVVHFKRLRTLNCTYSNLNLVLASLRISLSMDGPSPCYPMRTWDTRRHAIPSDRRWASPFPKLVSLPSMIPPSATSTLGEYQPEAQRCVNIQEDGAQRREDIDFNPMELLWPCSRSKPSGVGIVTLSTFLQFWGVVFLATTLFVCFFKPEVENGTSTKTFGLLDTYKQVNAKAGCQVYGPATS